MTCEIYVTVALICMGMMVLLLAGGIFLDVLLEWKEAKKAGRI